MNGDTIHWILLILQIIILVLLLVPGLPWRR
jgi:hypothetical protein